MDSNAPFCEAVGRPAFDWHDYLARCLSEKEISTEEYEKARELSGSWVTCAVGNQCAILPRDLDDNAPEDEELKELGAVFHWQIITDRYFLARITLEQIEQRAAFLIDQIRKEANNG